MPRLREGGVLLAFASDRSGQRQIHTVYQDGDRPRQLTFLNGNCFDPVWSADGQRLAYVSDAAGKYDIYVSTIRDDAAQDTLCLTCGSGHDHFSPAWSPTGNQIAYVQRSLSEATGKLWRVDADARNPAQLTGDLWYLDNPVFSPDGATVAFDYAHNQSAWNRIGRMNAAGGAVTDIYSPGQDFVDAWMGSWAPDGQAILFSRVEYAVQNNQLVIRNTYVEQVPAAGGSAARLPWNTGYDLNPDAKLRTDGIAPASNMLRLPTYTRAETALSAFPIATSDQGGSGFSAVEVQHKAGQVGVWTTPASGPTTTFQTYAGQTVYFRTRARDHEGNLEQWPTNPDGDARTTFYATMIQGWVRDTRDIPLVRPRITFTPSQVVSDSAGGSRFSARLRTYGQQLLQFVKPGYALPFPARIWMSGDQEFNANMYPEQEAVRNGHFEMGAPGAAGWLTSGTYAPIAAEGGHTGNSALWMQAGKWLVSPLPYPVSHLLAETNGVLHALMWNEAEGVLLHAVKSPAGAWPVSPASIPIPYVASGNPLAPPVFKSDGAGGLHVFYNTVEGFGDWPLRYCHIAGASNVCAEQVVIGYTGSCPFKADVAPDGAAHVTWVQGNELKYAYKLPGGAWSAAQAIANTGCAFLHDMEVDDLGVVHVMYEHGFTLMYLSRSRNGSWSPPAHTIDPSSCDNGMCSTFGVLGVSPGGTVHAILAVINVGYVSYTKSPASSQWIASPVPMPQEYPSDLVVDRYGTAHLITPDGYRTLSAAASSWTYQPVSGYQASIDENGKAFLLRGPDYVKYDLYALPTYTLPQALQRVTIPAGWHKPTLSFQYQAQSAQGQLPRLSYSVSDGSLTISDVITVSNVQWARLWRDAEPLAGKAVTITFRSVDEASDGEIFIDEVSIGPWETPVISSASPSRIEVHSPATLITITGANFITTPVVRLGNILLTGIAQNGETFLQAVIPANLPVGIHDLWISNPGGQESVLAGAVLVGSQYFLPLALKE